jgi:hypothetical protein
MRTEKEDLQNFSVESLAFFKLIVLISSIQHLTIFTEKVNVHDPIEASQQFHEVNITPSCICLFSKCLHYINHCSLQPHVKNGNRSMQI